MKKNIFCFLAFRYDQGSLQRLEDLLTECQGLMDPGATLCCALQTNTVMDYGGGYDKKWKELIHMTQNHLKSMNFYLPHLDVNFRNSSLVFESSNSIEKNGGYETSSDNVLNVLGTPTTGTTLTQTPVYELNFNWRVGRENQIDLDDIIKYTVSLFEKEVSSPDAPFVVLYDESRFKMEGIFAALKPCVPTGVNIYRYPLFGDSDPEKEIDQFLDRNEGCLLTSQVLFKGAEAENIFSLQTSEAVSSNVRGTILRSVSRLYILNGVDENAMMSIKNVKNEDSFLKCFENCFQVINECKTCNEKSEENTLVCLPCKINCHRSHELESRSILRLRISGICTCKICHE